MTDEIPPSRSSAPPSPPELDARLDRVLRLFTRLSLICLAAGLAGALVWPGALAARVLLHTGIILLLASPGSRLVVIVAVHGHKRQWAIVVMAAVTLAIMMSSLVAGLLVLLVR
ncbi:MAG: hypothetical protein Q8L86_19760 [Vicinamibacterales bacterium]|nr:hypothetical protein [Vicinamibacterales bacterium]